MWKAEGRNMLLTSKDSHTNSLALLTRTFRLSTIKLLIVSTDDIYILNNQIVIRVYRNGWKTGLYPQIEINCYCTNFS